MRDAIISELTSIYIYYQYVKSVRKRFQFGNDFRTKVNPVSSSEMIDSQTHKIHVPMSCIPPWGRISKAASAAEWSKTVLTFMEKKGRFCPVILCDVCRKRIRRADAAGVCGVEAGEPLRFFHAECDVDARHNTEDFVYYEDMDVFLTFLDHNLSFNRKASHERAMILASLGAS